MKKGQFELIPTVFFLIFLFLFFIIALIVYFEYWKNKIMEQKNFLEKISYFTTAEQFVSLPYVNCGRITEKFACLDFYKIRNFNELLKYDSLKRELRGIFFRQGQKKVEIKIIFEEGLRECNNLNLLPNNLNCYYLIYNETLSLSSYYKSKDVIRIPVLVRYKDSSKPENMFEYKVAILEVSVYY
ncbi:MAG TPA: hypothetical protein EYH54_04980 [Nautiliaceae bacterium]|nr:hypothetical protein [Nautiliaceae bacterium]